MQILRCSSSAKSIAELAAKSKGLLFLSPSAVKTAKELEFAFYLAREAFADRTSISNDLAKEALLFLACETNFSSAVEKIGAKSAKDFVLVSGKRMPLAKLKKEMLLTKIASVSLPELGMKKSGKDFFRSGMSMRILRSKMHQTSRQSAMLKANSTQKKKGGYFEGELAIERMALARVKN